MEPEGSNSSGATIARGSTVKAEELRLLEKFFHLVASGALMHLQDLPEVRDLIRQTCQKAPDAARIFAIAILEGSSSEDSPSEAAVKDSRIEETLKRKRNSNKDLSYRPPRGAQQQASSFGNLLEGDGISAKDAGPDQDALEKEDPLADEDLDAAERAEANEVTSASNVTKNQQIRFPQSEFHTTHYIPLSTDTAPATPTRQMVAAPTSPLTEEIPRAKIPTSVESFCSSPGPTADPSPPEAVPLVDMIIEAVRIIHQFSKYSHAAPREVHSRILQTLRNDNQKAIMAANLNQWSDGSMWMQVLEMGSAQNQKVTILNMLEYMGAWEWYDKQIELSQMTIRTKKNKPVDRRGAAIHVLNQMQNAHLSSGQGRWISGVGRVALTTDGGGSALTPVDDKLGFNERSRQAQRKHISMQLSRGQKLSTKLVKELGLGILFSPKIWEYTKKNGEQLEVLIRDIQADSGRMKLLQILEPQLEQLVNEGCPDIGGLYDALNNEDLISQDELQELRMMFALDSDTIPKGTLDAAVDGLIAHVGQKVLGKRKMPDEESVAVNNNVELSCSMFNRLREGRWFDDEIIMAAMDISDKSFFTRHGRSIPLDDVGRTGRIKPYKRPLAAWAQKISEFRQQAREKFGDSVRLVYFCPLNHRNNHFTLLEINEREEVIRHYDSMADQSTIGGTSHSTRVGRQVQIEFGDLGYAYSEAPTPQQDDIWSCGVRVVWNFRRLANNLRIGGWESSVSPERMKMEIVEGLMACVEGNAMKRFRTEPKFSSSKAQKQLEKAEDESS